MDTTTLKTVTEIAAELAKPDYSIAYIIRTRGIVEARRVGIIRLYDEAAVEQIKSALADK